jgi:hypothetical protein
MISPASKNGVWRETIKLLFNKENESIEYYKC